MRTAERLVLYPAVAVALILAVRQPLERPAGATTAALAADQPAARLAIVDLYTVADELVKSATFDTPRKAEQDRHTKTLEPMDKELRELQKFLETADPKVEENQTKFQDFQQKRQAFNDAQQRAQADYSSFISKQFADAYVQARDAAAALAKSQGFTHLISSRAQSELIDTGDPQRVLEELQLRPVALAPEGADLTKALMTELKLPAPAAAPAAAPDAAAPATAPADKK
jgi:Skp family chaperone for outer membrane proteins